MYEKEIRVQNPERNIIIPDFRTVKTVDIPPESTVPVQVQLSSDFQKLVSSIDLTPASTAYWHGRSFLARRGLVLNPYIGALDFIQQAKNKPQTSITVPFENYSPNHFQILEGSGVCTIGFFPDAPLTGDELKKAIQQEIGLFGSYWRYFLDENSGDPIGIEMDINPLVQKVLGAFTERIILNGDTGRNHDRYNDGLYHCVAKPTEDSQLWIGTTVSRIYIPPSIDGVIVGVRERGGTETGHEDIESEQVPSVILQGGRTGTIDRKGHPIITEIFGPTGGVERAESIRIQLHRHK